MSEPVAVTPIYGYGWRWPETSCRAWDYVPQPFQATVLPRTETWYGKSVPTMQGSVTAERHEFNGYWVLLSPRHELWDGFVNVTLRSGEGTEVHGFGTVDLATFNG